MVWPCCSIFGKIEDPLPHKPLLLPNGQLTSDRQTANRRPSNGQQTANIIRLSSKLIKCLPAAAKLLATCRFLVSDLLASCCWASDMYVCMYVAIKPIVTQYNIGCYNEQFNHSKKIAKKILLVMLLIFNPTQSPKMKPVAMVSHAQL